MYSFQELKQQSSGFCKSYFPEEENKHSENVTASMGHRNKRDGVEKGIRPSEKG